MPFFKLIIDLVVKLWALVQAQAHAGRSNQYYLRLQNLQEKNKQRFFALVPTIIFSALWFTHVDQFIFELPFFGDGIINSLVAGSPYWLFFFLGLFSVAVNELRYLIKDKLPVESHSLFMFLSQWCLILVTFFFVSPVQRMYVVAMKFKSYQAGVFSADVFQTTSVKITAAMTSTQVQQGVADCLQSLPLFAEYCQKHPRAESQLTNLLCNHKIMEANAFVTKGLSWVDQEAAEVLKNQRSWYSSLSEGCSYFSQCCVTTTTTIYEQGGPIVGTVVVVGSCVAVVYGTYAMIMFLSAWATGSAANQMQTTQDLAANTAQGFATVVRNQELLSQQLMGQIAAVSRQVAATNTVQAACNIKLDATVSSLATLKARVTVHGQLYTRMQAAFEQQQLADNLINNMTQRELLGIIQHTWVLLHSALLFPNAVRVADFATRLPEQVARLCTLLEQREASLKAQLNPKPPNNLPDLD